MKQSSRRAFTLVELIVVITILAVLGTIAFISFQSYTKSARDVVRTSDLSSISRAITIKVAQGGYAPKPANAINITASGAVVMYQGEFTKEIGRRYGINGELVDPLDGKNYTYVADKNLFKHELAGFLEGDTAVNTDVFSETYAATGRTVITKGDKLGIVFTPEEVAIQDLMASGSTLDIVNTTDTYKVFLDNSDTLEGTGSTLAKLNPKASCRRILEMGYAKRGDKASGVYKINPTGASEFEVYCDMMTDGGGWTQVVAFKGDDSLNSLSYTDYAGVGWKGTPGIGVFQDTNLQYLNTFFSTGYTDVLGSNIRITNGIDRLSWDMPGFNSLYHFVDGDGKKDPHYLASEPLEGWAFNENLSYRKGENTSNLGKRWGEYLKVRCRDGREAHSDDAVFGFTSDTIDSAGNYCEGIGYIQLGSTIHTYRKNTRWYRESVIGEIIENGSGWVSDANFYNIWIR